MALSAAAVAFVVGGAATGCADPQGSFDEFNDRYDELNPGGGTGTGTGTPTSCGLPLENELEGTYLFALAAVIGPTKPVRFLATFSNDADGNFSFILQPLATVDNGGAPIGSSYDLGPFPINEDGSFSAQLPLLAVPGDGNPLTGSDLEATALLEGSICEMRDDPGIFNGFICGGVSGNVSKPTNINLDGSTFAASRLEDPTMVPDTAVINCNGDAF